MPDCCCVPRGDESAPAATVFPSACPQCGRTGKPVSLLTLKHQVKLRHLATVETGPFAFCGTPDCPVVYFSPPNHVLTVEDVRQRPTAKGGDNPPLCFCFGIDTAMVRAEIAATGDTTIPERIAAEMQAGRCACEIRNPQGSCCFASVKAAVHRERALARARSGTEGA